ncbi:hypothetical protein TIFTF001_030210 [Ficus carica]|uniref:Uncharacterized protein n=1 Tax=Ficus carica TaxID=3494 RepID=A0AA88J3F5_FICCA|nr:hypothetical protein TIFTF001_030210 [Ficus carica]
MFLMRVGGRGFRLEERLMTITGLIGMGLMKEEIQWVVTGDLDGIEELGIRKMIVCVTPRPTYSHCCGSIPAHAILAASPSCSLHVRQLRSVTPAASPSTRIRCQPRPVIPAPDHSKPARILGRILSQARVTFGPCPQSSPRRSGASSSPGHPVTPDGLPRVSTRLTSLIA